MQVQYVEVTKILYLPQSLFVFGILLTCSLNNRNNMVADTVMFARSK